MLLRKAAKNVRKVSAPNPSPPQAVQAPPPKPKSFWDRLKAGEKS